MKKAIYILSIISFAFTATWFLTERVKTPAQTMNSLYLANLKPCMNYWTTDPQFMDTVSLKAQAMKLYDQGEFTLALEAFQRFEPETHEEALYNLYLGICYLKSDFTNLGIMHLTEATDQFSKFEMVQLSRWYLSLGFLKAGKEKEAVENFKKIVEVNAPQRYMSEEILKEIDIATHPIKGILLAFQGNR